MSDANHVDQVGGQHYQAGAAMQHWDYIEKYDIDYLTATATKYIMRWRKKGTPKLDLGKAASYVEKAIKCRKVRTGCNPQRRLALRRMPEGAVEDMCQAAGVIDLSDLRLVKLLLCSGSYLDYISAGEALRAMEARCS